MRWRSWRRRLPKGSRSMGRRSEIGVLHRLGWPKIFFWDRVRSMALQSGLEKSLARSEDVQKPSQYCCGVGYSLDTCCHDTCDVTPSRTCDSSCAEPSRHDSCASSALPSLSLSMILQTPSFLTSPTKRSTPVPVSSSATLCTVGTPRNEAFLTLNERRDDRLLRHSSSAR